MPYSIAQCRKFAAMAARGEPVPDDWRKHCRKKSPAKKTTPRRKK